MRVRFLLCLAVPLGAAIVATPAAAQDALCASNAIGARFSEAQKLCGTPAATPRSAAATPAVPVMLPAATPVFASAPVSVSMPGYRKRLAAAVQQVRIRAHNGVPTDALITAIGRRYRIDPHLLASMMSAESGGRMSAVSNKGALGLMQVMPGTARSLGVRDPRMLLNDRVLAISTGAAYLKKLQAQFGNNVPLVVAAYNAGPGAVVRYNGIPRYRETQGYVTRVMSGYVSRRSGAVR